MVQENIFITGTDTNIGKTVLSFLVMKYFFNKGFTPFYLKPFQTGCKSSVDNDSDADFIYRNIRQLKDKDPSESIIYCLQNPKAPLFAARDDKISIEVSKIDKIILEKARTFNPIVIEGAGGLFVPIDKETMIVDIIEKIDVKIVLTARAGLGTINHTLLSIEALRNRGILNPAVVLINQKNDPVSEEMLKENIEAIEIFSDIKVAGVINHIDDFANINNSHFEVIEKIMTD